MAGPTDARGVAPGADELEVSLIGPGYGECVLVHFGAGAWIIVDSCIDVRTRRPVALDYLNAIGVSATAVKLVVATHWHDDHIRGLADVLRAATKARFVVSVAFRSVELTTLVSVVEPRLTQRSSGVAELASIYGHLGERGTPPEFATADRRLHRGAGKLRREVWSLSPSNRSIELALRAIAQIIEDRDLPNRRVPELRPNHTSVVLWCEMAETAVLLGADLEETADEHTGWRAIVASTTRPEGSASVFKVPHHGALSAHSDAVWEQMLDADAIGLITPFSRGRGPLPTPADRARIRGKGGLSYLTSDGTAPSSAWPAPVTATLSEATAGIRDAEPLPGHVRLRRRIGTSSWAVELFGTATTL